MCLGCRPRCNVWDTFCVSHTAVDLCNPRIDAKKWLNLSINNSCSCLITIPMLWRSIASWFRITWCLPLADVTEPLVIVINIKGNLLVVICWSFLINGLHAPAPIGTLVTLVTCHPNLDESILSEPVRFDMRNKIFWLAADRKWD